MSPDGPPFDAGAASGTITEQPGGPFARFERVPFSWRGGALGLDLPPDRAFVRVVRLRSRRPRRKTVDSGVGLGMLWKVGDQGNYQALYEIPRHPPAGRYAS